MRNHIHVKYKPGVYHKGGEPIVVRKAPRCFGRSFRAFISDDLPALAKYARHRMAQGIHWSQI